MKSVFLLCLVSCSLANAQWQRVPEVPETLGVYSLLVVHDTLYAGTDSVVYVGANGGTQWSAGVPPAGSPAVISCMLKDHTVLVAGTYRAGIFKSTNDGLSWQPFSAGLSGLGAMDISNLLVRRDSLIAGTYGAGVFVTAADYSHPWARWGDSLAEYQGENVFKMLCVGNTVLAGGGANGYMFRYTDAQPWWNPVLINTPQMVGQTVSGMMSGPTAVVAGTSSGIYRSTNEGLSWERTSAQIPPGTFSIFLDSHDSTIFAVTTTPVSSSLLFSTDEGGSWTSLGVISLPNVLDIAIVGETFYLGLPAGLWRAPISSLLTTVGGMDEEPRTFALQQNYPNPFNPKTVIGYTVGGTGLQASGVSEVRLSVYDILGREVAVLMNERKMPGKYEVEFDASGLSSGVYFYRLEVERFVETKKLVLLR